MATERTLVPHIREWRRHGLLIAGAALGIVLLLAGNLPAQTDAESAAIATAAAAELDAYTAALEEKIAALCAGVDGVGEVYVAVSLESGYRRVYARDEDSYILVGSGSSQSGVHLTDQPPAIGGIGIVCTGGGDPVIRARLIGLLCAAYDLGANQIYIAKAQN